jgi:hypothetical protein
MFACCSMGHLPADRWQRRMLRNAVHSRDVDKIQDVINMGVDINMVISDVFYDTPLTYAIKYGYLEVVEFLVNLAECHVDMKVKNKHTALDEAVGSWLNSASAVHKTKQDQGKYFRILRCLLKRGAKEIAERSLDMVIFSTLNATNGKVAIEKLVKVVCQRSCARVQTSLFVVLSRYEQTSFFLRMLLQAGANPSVYLYRDPPRPYLPFDNALVLIQATNDPKILARVECDASSQLRLVEDQWYKYRHVVRLLQLCGHQIRLAIMSMIYQKHADMYLWTMNYSGQPRRLDHLCRVLIRKQIRENLFRGLRKLPLPESFVPFLILKEENL